MTSHDAVSGTHNPHDRVSGTHRLFGRKLTAAVDGLDGAPCPIELI